MDCTNLELFNIFMAMLIYCEIDLYRYFWKFIFKLGGQLDGQTL